MPAWTPHQTSPNVDLLTRLITRSLKEHRTGANLRCRGQVDAEHRSGSKNYTQGCNAHRPSPSAGWTSEALRVKLISQR